LAEELKVGNQRDWKDHVALKSKCAGRDIEGAMNGGADCVSGGGKEIVDDVDSVFVILGMDGTQEST